MDTSSYKPGLEGVIAGISAVSMVDAEKNELLYRGYDIHDLVEHCSMDEVAYLLLYGELPERAALEAFNQRIRTDREVPPALYELFRTMPNNAHPMDRLKAAVALLAMFLPEDESNLRKAERLYAKLPTLVCASWRISQGQEPIAPDSSLDHNASFFHLLTGTPRTDYLAHVFNVTQILYAEHGFNASTFAARVTVSTLSDLYSGVVSAIGTLKGPLHGGANEAAMEMLQEIGSPESAQQWVRDALVQKKKIMGFGHREYKHGDERAKIVKGYAKELAERTGNTLWWEISELVEAEMLAVKKLHPNLDFPVASVYYLMELPIPVYTPIFVLSRTTGWSAHIIEQLENNRIIRPGHLYNGLEKRSLAPR